MGDWGVRCQRRCRSRSRKERQQRQNFVTAVTAAVCLRSDTRDLLPTAVDWFEVATGSFSVPGQPGASRNIGWSTGSDQFGPGDQRDRCAGQRCTDSGWEVAGEGCRRARLPGSCSVGRDRAVEIRRCARPRRSLPRVRKLQHVRLGVRSAEQFHSNWQATFGEADGNREGR